MKLSYDIQKTENNTTKIIKLSDHKIISIIISIILRFFSYYLFTPLVFLLWINLIFFIIYIQTSWIIDISALFDSLGKLLYNIFWDQLSKWWDSSINHYQCSWEKCENDLKNFIWEIIFIISLIFWLIDFLYKKLFNKNIKINLLKIIKYILILSYFWYIIFFYYMWEMWENWSIIILSIITIPLLLYVYISSFLALKVNKWSWIIYDEALIINNKNKND